jgi:hypothetical protein
MHQLRCGFGLLSGAGIERNQCPRVRAALVEKTVEANRALLREAWGAEKARVFPIRGSF